MSVHRLPSSLQLNQNQSFRGEAKKRDKTGKVVNAPIPSRASRLTTERFLRQWGRAAVGLVADGATGTRFGAKRASEMYGLGHIIQLYNLASELCFITLINRQSTIKDGGSLVLYATQNFGHPGSTNELVGLVLWLYLYIVLSHLLLGSVYITLLC